MRYDVVVGAEAVYVVDATDLYAEIFDTVDEAEEYAARVEKWSERSRADRLRSHYYKASRWVRWYWYLAVRYVQDVKWRLGWAR